MIIHGEGMYFITICTKNRENILSKINVDNVGAHDCARNEISTIGKIVITELKKTEILNKGIQINYYVIMPNHIHLIIEINERAQSCAPTIGKIIRGIKASVTGQLKYSIWQRNYYEHIIRNEKEMLKIIEYIENNPYRWKEDENYKEM